MINSPPCLPLSPDEPERMQNSITSWTPFPLFPTPKKCIVSIFAGDEISEVSSSGKLFLCKTERIYLSVWWQIVVADIYLIPRPGPGPVKSLATYMYLVGWYMYASQQASKQARDKTGRYKACSVLLLGMSRDRRIALCIPYTYTCWFYTLTLPA